MTYVNEPNTIPTYFIFGVKAYVRVSAFGQSIMGYEETKNKLVCK